MKFARLAIIVVAIVFVAAPERAASQSGTSLPWTSEFETNDFTEWDGGYFSSTNLLVTTTGCFSGRCARCDVVPGGVGVNYANRNFGDWYRLGGTKVEEVWLRFYSKFSAGMVWPNRSQKMAIINLTNGQDNERRYQVYVYVNPQGRYAVDRSDIAAWRFYGLPQNVGTAVSVRPDQWDKIKLYVRLNTPGQSNGIVRLWVNDQLKAEHTNVPIRADTSYGMNRLILSNSATQETVSNGYQWWDSWTLSQTDPDQGAGTPAPPSNLRIVP
jgi:hypothetical protein